MVLQMVVGIGDKDGEHDPPPEFVKVFDWVAGDLPYQIGNVGIEATVLALPVERGACGDIRDTGRAPAVEPPNECNRMIAGGEFQPRFGSA